MDYYGDTFLIVVFLFLIVFWLIIINPILTVIINRMIDKHMKTKYGLSMPQEGVFKWGKRKSIKKKLV